MKLWEWLIFIILFTICVFSMYSLVHAETKFNPFTGKWEITSKDGKLEYNPFDGSYSYQQPGAQLEYNAFDNTWDYAPPDRPKRAKKKGGNK